MDKLLNTIREHQADICVLLFAITSIVGIAMLAAYPADEGDEMMRLAENLAHHGMFANPFGSIETGPTAANPPLYPLLVAVLIKLFRVPVLVHYATVAATLFANAVTASLLPRMSLVFFGDSVPGVAASIMWLPVMPMMPGWDTSFTVVGILVFCLMTESSAGRQNTSMVAAGAGVVAGMLALFNPSALLIVLAWLACMLWQPRSNIRTPLRGATLCLAVLSLFVGGWSLRNYRQLGAFVIRTNLGMTLYSSNNDCAQSSLFRDQLKGCYQAHHPNVSVDEARMLQSLGEVRYDRNRIVATLDWVKSNPKKFARLTAARILEFWLPATESLPAGSAAPDWFGAWLRQQNFVAHAIWAITALSLPGLFLMVRTREPVTAFVLLVLLIYPLMYYVVVSDMRYRYPVLWLSLLLSGYFLRALIEPEQRRWKPVGEGLPTA